MPLTRRIGRIVGKGIAQKRATDEFMNSDPQARLELERIRNKRYLMIGGAALAGIGLLGVGAYGVANRVSSGIESITSDIKDALTPEEIALAVINSRLESIETEEDLTVVSGKVSGTSVVIAKKDYKIVTVPDSITTASIKGTLNKKIDGFSENTKLLVRKNDKGEYRLFIVLNPEAVKTELTDKHAIDLWAQDSKLRGIVGTVKGNDDKSERSGELEEYTIQRVSNECSKPLDMVVPDAAGMAIANIVRATTLIDIEHSGDDLQSKIMKEALNNEPVVQIGSSIDGVSVSYVFKTGEVWTKQKLAEQMGLDPDHTDVQSANDCSLSAQAAADLVRIKEATYPESATGGK